MSGRLVFTPVEAFAGVKEPNAAALATAPDGGSVIPSDGTVLLYGDGGASKTTMALDIAFALAANESWLELITPGRAVKSAIIEAEGPRQEFRDKLSAKLAHRSAYGRIEVLEDPWAQFSLADEQQRAELAEYVREQQVDLLIVGPVVAVGMIGGGTPDEVHTFELLLADLRRQVGRPLAVLLIHHENRTGKVSGAWERVPDTLVHVTLEGRGSRLYWQKVKWSSELHAATTHLVWAEGASFVVADAKPVVSDDSIADELIAAVKAHGGSSWTKLRELENDDGVRVVRGEATAIVRVRDRLLADGTLVNTASRKGGFNLWHKLDPAANRSDAGTGRERLPFGPAAGGDSDVPFSVPVRSRERNENGTESAPHLWPGNGTDPDPVDEGVGGVTWAEAEAAAVELGRRTGEHGHAAADVIAEARRLRGES